jgi:hypothetical protein
VGGFRESKKFSDIKVQSNKKLQNVELRY